MDACIEAGQVWLLGTHALRVESVGRSRHVLACRPGEDARLYHRDMVRSGERLTGHPWETDPGWREGDAYRLDGGPYEFTIIKRRLGRDIARSPASGRGRRSVLDTEWGTALTFTPSWTPISTEPAGGDSLTSAQNEPIITMADVAEAGLVATDERMVLEMPRLPGESIDNATARLQSLRARIQDPAVAIRMVDAGACDEAPARHTRDGIQLIAAVQAQEPLPEQLTPDELIAVVQELRPPERNEAAWRYAVGRLFREDESLMDPSAYGLGYISPGCADGFARCIDVHIGLTGSLPRRLYLDGLREAALAAMPCPSGHDAERWRRKCMGYIEDCGHDVEWTEEIAASAYHMHPDTDDPGPSGKWWQGEGCGVARGAHLDDVTEVES